MQGLETKFHQPAGPGVVLAEGSVIQGYASVFGVKDRGGDIVMPGAYAASLRRMAAAGGRVRMLWQHDQGQPIGVWDEVVEDAQGLRVKGRLLPEVEKGREAAALMAAGAVDGLSIGYRTVRAEKLPEGGRKLIELELWEVSLVTFPMLPIARASAKSEAGLLGEFARGIDAARRALKG
jgi:phage prohead protease, HK97 family